MKRIYQQICERKLPQWFTAPAQDDGSSIDIYISAYPAVAQHLVSRIGGCGKTIAEVCCGVGASAIYLVNTFTEYVGIDNSEQVLRFCRENIQKAQTGKDKNYYLHNCDVSTQHKELRMILKKHHVDIVLYDIPWWYTHDGNRYPAKNPNLETLIAAIRRVTENIVIYAPSYMDSSYFSEAVGACEIEEIFLRTKNGEKRDQNIVYLGDLIKRPSPHEITLSV